MDTLKEIEPVVNIDDALDKSSKKKIKFDDMDSKAKKEDSLKNEVSEDAMLIATILQYFVTPPYLTRSLFKSKFFKNFQYAKTFPKLTTLPFMCEEAEPKYREGLTVTMGKVSKPLTKSKKSQPLKNTKYVNIGYDKYLELSGQQVPTNVRVTVDTELKKVVSPLEAYKDKVGAKSAYGYHVRIAKKFTSIFTESSFPEGYTQSLYVNSGDYFHHNKDAELKEIGLSDNTKEANILLVVGKWKDVEYSFDQDSANLEGVSNAKEFFDGQVRIPSGTKVEDGSMIALTKLVNL